MASVPLSKKKSNHNPWDSEPQDVHDDDDDDDDISRGQTEFTSTIFIHKDEL